MQCIIKALFLATAAFTAGSSIAADAPAAGSPWTPATLISAPADKELGMWAWHREDVIDPVRRASLLAFTQNAGIKRVFIQVRMNEKDGAYTLGDAEGMKTLLAEAAKLGVQVEALDGAKDMAFAENRAVTLAKLDAVLAFHRSLPAGAGFAGIHYDIEPYLSSRWKSGDEQGVMRETLETFVIMRDRVKAADPKLSISHDIPAWYDQKPQLTLEFNGATKNFHQHIQDVSDYIGIMSYRRKATGANSVVAIIADELAYARKIGKRVYPALETVPLKEEPSITFDGREPGEFRAVLTGIQDALRDDPAFGGVLLHQYNAVRALLEKDAPTTEPKR